MAVQLNLALWNANGLSQHKQELLSFMTNHNIDIMMVSESHFTNKSFINFPNYVVYDTKHPDGSGHGGTAIIIKKNQTS